MRKVLLTLGKQFASNSWGVAFANQSGSLSFECKDGLPESMPFPGAILGEDGINQIIDFLKATLEEKGSDDAESNVE